MSVCPFPSGSFPIHSCSGTGTSLPPGSVFKVVEDGGQQVAQALADAEADAC